MPKSSKEDRKEPESQSPSKLSKSNYVNMKTKNERIIRNTA